MEPDVEKFHEIIRMESTYREGHHKECLDEIISTTDGLNDKKDILWTLEVSEGRIRNKIVGDDIDNAEDIAAIVSYVFDFCRDIFPNQEFLIDNIHRFL